MQSCSIVPAPLATSIPCPTGPSVTIDLPCPAGQSGWWAGSEHPWFAPPPSYPARCSHCLHLCFPYCTWCCQCLWAGRQRSQAKDKAFHFPPSPPLPTANTHTLPQSNSPLTVTNSEVGSRSAKACQEVQETSCFTPSLAIVVSCSYTWLCLLLLSTLLLFYLTLYFCSLIIFAIHKSWLWIPCQLHSVTVLIPVR